LRRFAVALYTQGYIEDWADEYMRRYHNDVIYIEHLSITDDDYVDFCNFIADKEIPYESETRKALKALESAAERELYDDHMGEALEGLKSLIRDDKMSNMQTYKSDVVDAINADIILRYAYNSGVMQHAAANDEDVAQAVDLLLNGDEYNRILREQHLDKH
jgi:carboxyl-terminal processing protease